MSPGLNSRDQYSLVIANKSTASQAAVAGQPAANMSMKMKVDSRRLGECDGTEANPAAVPPPPQGIQQ